jgi:hypothetical protein
MYQKAIVSVGMSAAVLWIFLGIFSIIPWQVAGVLAAVSIGIPSLLLTYERGKPRTSASQGKLEENYEEKEQENPAPAKPEEKGQQVSTGSLLLPDTTDITKLGIDNNFLDKIYEEARSKAVNTYNDARLSYFAIQVFPFEKARSFVCVYFDFYSKWAGRICSFQYSDLSSTLRHSMPNKPATTDYQKGLFGQLPWKTNPRYLELLRRCYDRIKPLPSVEGTNYLLFVNGSQEHWSLKFEDGLNGNEYWFDWDGKGLDESNVKQNP